MSAAGLSLTDLPENGVIDLNGAALTAFDLDVSSDLTIRNGSLRLWNSEDAVFQIAQGASLYCQNVQMSGSSGGVTLGGGGSLVDLGGLEIDDTYLTVEMKVHISALGPDGTMTDCGEKDQFQIVDSSANGTTPRWSSQYLVQGEVTLNQVMVLGDDVLLVLEDGAKLTVKGGIRLEPGAQLTITARSTGEEAGQLVTTGYDNMPGIGDIMSGRIVINGGRITATGGEDAPGIGAISDQPDDYFSFTLNGGVLDVTGGEGFPGIGIAKGDGFGTITVNGGVLTAAGAGGAGIKGSFSTGKGNGVVFASSITDQSGKTSGSWNGVIVEGDAGKVYGAVRRTAGFTIPAGKTVTVPAGASLTLTGGAAVENEGTLVLELNSAWNGALPARGALCEIGWDTDGNGTVDKTSRCAAGSTPSYPGQAPSKAGYRFAGWSPEISAASSPCLYTAQFEKEQPSTGSGATGGGSTGNNNTGSGSTGSTGSTGGSATTGSTGSALSGKKPASGGKLTASKEETEQESSSAPAAQEQENSAASAQDSSSSSSAAPEAESGAAETAAEQTSSGSSLPALGIGLLVLAVAAALFLLFRRKRG